VIIHNKITLFELSRNLKLERTELSLTLGVAVFSLCTCIYTKAKQKTLDDGRIRPKRVARKKDN
jgi:hypothetical protein